MFKAPVQRFDVEYSDFLVITTEKIVRKKNKDVEKEKDV